MKHKVTLTIASLLSILLFLFHLTDDIIHGIEPGGLSNLVGGVLILVVWLSGTLVFAERRSGYVIMLLGGLFAAAIPVLHMRGAGVGGEFAKTGTFSVILSASGLWRLQWGHARQSNNANMERPTPA